MKNIYKKSLCADRAEANSERNLYNPPQKVRHKLPPPPNGSFIVFSLFPAFSPYKV